MDSKHLKYKNILITRFSALGDVAMTIPVVYSACRAYPSVRFVMATQQVAATLFINAPENLVVEGVDVKQEKYHGPQGMWRLFHELRTAYQIDAFIDLHNVIRTHFLCACGWLHGIPVKRIHKGRSSKRRMTRKRHKHLNPLCSSRDRYFDVFRRMGLEFGEAFSSLFLTLPNPQIFSDITAPKQPEETWIAIAPFAKHAGKIYPVEKMSVVVKTLAARKGTKLFLFGGGGHEQMMLRAWAEQHANVLSMAEKRHGFPKELALLSHMDVMLSMDSANMHLASLVQLPVVSIWGATHPYCGFTGWKQPIENCVQIEELPCRPCSVFGNKPCYRGDYQCLNGIPPETVVKKIEQVLSERKR